MAAPPLQARGVIVGEALAQHLMGVAHDDEGVRVDALHQLLDGDEVPATEGAQDDPLFLAAPGPLTVQQGDAPVQLQQLLGDGLILLADDIGHLGGVGTVHHPVDEQRQDIQGHHAVHGPGHIPEAQGVPDGHGHVQAQTEAADGQPLELQLQQPGGHLRAAGGGAFVQQQAAADARHDAAVDTGQNGVHGREGVDRGQHVDHQGADGGGIQGRDQQIPADLLPAQDEQGDVQHQGDGTHRQHRQKVIDDLGNAGEAAHGEVIGHEEPVEAQGIQGTGHGDQSVALQSLGSGHNRHLSFRMCGGKRVFITRSAVPRPGPRA